MALCSRPPVTIYALSGVSVYLPTCLQQYILAYLESMGLVRQGQRVLQIGMGGGMKVTDQGIEFCLVFPLIICTCIIHRPGSAAKEGR